MNFIKYIPMLIISFFVVSCGDFNALEWGANEKTTEAKTDKLGFAFIEGNCQYIIDELEPRAAYLNETEKYQYSNAVLACSGFDLLGSLNVLLDKSTGGKVDPYGTIQSLIGTSSVNKDKVKELKDSYAKVLSSGTCNGATSDLAVVCGMAAAADTVLSVADVALNLTCPNPDDKENCKDSVDITEAGMKEIVAGKSQEEIKAAVDKSITNNTITTSGLSGNLDVLTSSSGAMASMVGDGNTNKFSKQLDELKNTISTTDKDAGKQVVSSDSLASYIFTEIGGNKTEGEGN